MPGRRGGHELLGGSSGLPNFKDTPPRLTPFPPGLGRAQGFRALAEWLLR